MKSKNTFVDYRLWKTHLIIHFEEHSIFSTLLAFKDAFWQIFWPRLKKNLKETTTLKQWSKKTRFINMTIICRCDCLCYTCDVWFENFFCEKNWKKKRETDTFYPQWNFSCFSQFLGGQNEPFDRKKKNHEITISIAPNIMPHKLF